MKPGGNGNVREVQNGEKRGEKGAESGHYSHPVLQKVPCFHVVLRTCRSPPVLISGMIYPLFRIPGCGREVAVCASWIPNNNHNDQMGAGPYIGGITDINPHERVRNGELSAQHSPNDRMAGRGDLPAQHYHNIGDIPRVVPSSIQSSIRYSR